MNEPVETFQAAALCPSCQQPAYIVAEARIEVGSTGASVCGRITDVRHVTPNGSNNCGGIA